MIVMSILSNKAMKLDLFNFLAGIIFCICSFKAKPVSLALADIYNCWVFYGVASAVSFWIVKLRSVSSGMKIFSSSRGIRIY